MAAPPVLRVFVSSPFWWAGRIAAYSGGAIDGYKRFRRITEAQAAEWTRGFQSVQP